MACTTLRMTRVMRFPFPATDATPAHAVLQRLLVVGLVAGLVAGLAVAALQHLTTTPLIVAAEVFEHARHAQKAAAFGAAAHEEFAQSPAQRTLSTSLAAAVTCVGYALILLALMLFAHKTIDARRAALWGACAFAATGLATGLGLAPQLPGAAETDLVGRQIWWLATAALTGAGLFALLNMQAVWAKALGAALLLAPHFYGAPQPAAPESTVPAELAARFTAASLTTQAVAWVLAGALAGLLWQAFARHESASTEATS
jgi:cobalt transporter subunit CbtA